MRSHTRLAPFLLGTALVLFSLCLLDTELFSAELQLSTQGREQGDWRFNASAVVSAGAPTLYVPGGLAAKAGELVEVPIAFDSFGTHVAALSFSLDYDEECLAFQPGDQDANGLPDAFSVHASGQFFPLVTWHPHHSHGELDVILADYIPPLAALPDTAALFTIQFRTICPVALGFKQEADVRFAATPAVGFSDPLGRDLPGIARDGVVQVIGAGDATVTPMQTPLPFSPTPTLIPTAPSTPTPAPMVFLELAAWPERVTRAERGIILSLGYVILTAMDDITLKVMLPTYVQFNDMTSTVGWQCEDSAATPTCQFPLYRQTGQNSMSGRVFFGVLLGGLLPLEVTQLEFTTTLVINGEAGYQIQQLLVPLLPTDVTPPSRRLALDVSTNTSELLIGRDHTLAYSFTYTNTSPAVLAEIDFYLLLPSVDAVRLAAEGQSDWLCASEGTEQQLCTFSIAELDLGAQRQAPFILELVQVSRLKEMYGLITVVYAVCEGRLLDSDVVVVPIQQDHGESNFMFLPLVTNQLP
jgi:hypothetical protein